MKTDRTSLLGVIRHYLKNTGTAETTFGVAAMNDPRFVWGLRNGRVPREKTAIRVMLFIGANPDGLPGKAVAA